MAESFPTLPSSLPAEYAENIAGLRHQFEGSLNEYLVGEQTAERKEGLALSELQKGEPEAEREQAGKFAARGLTQSGINARAIGRQKTGFLAKENRLTTGLAEQRANFQRLREKAKENLAEKEGKTIRESERAGLTEQEKEPGTGGEAGKPTYPTPQIVTGPPGPGGVAPAESQKVRVRPAKPVYETNKPYVPSETAKVRVGTRAENQFRQKGFVPSEAGGRGKGFVRVGTRTENRLRAAKRIKR